jgi:hypothetical protein
MNGCKTYNWLGMGTILLSAILFAGIGSAPVAMAKDSLIQEIQDVDNPARQPFQQELQFNVDDQHISQTKALVIPLGKLLVIETISAYFQTTIGNGGGLPQYPWFKVQTAVDASGTAVPHFFPLARTGEFNDTRGTTDTFMTCQPVRIYHDAGPDGSWQVQVIFDRNAALPSLGSTPRYWPINGSISLSGYLVSK